MSIYTTRYVHRAGIHLGGLVYDHPVLAHLRSTSVQVGRVGADGTVPVYRHGEQLCVAAAVQAMHFSRPPIAPGDREDLQ